MDQAQQQLFDAHLAWARKSAAVRHARMGVGAVSRDELESAALEGLWLAALGYQPGRGAFRTYATWKIRGAIGDYLRSVDWLPRSLRLQHPDATRHSLDIRYEKDGLTAGEQIPAPAAEPELDQSDELNHRLRHIQYRRRCVVERLLRGQLQREIGVEMSLGQCRVSQLVKEGLAALGIKEWHGGRGRRCLDAILEAV